MAKDKENTADTVSPEIARAAATKARDRALNARWDLNIAIFLFAVLILVIILVTYTKAGIEIVSPVAAFGLAMVWLTGWRRGKQLYQRFYEEELLSMGREDEKQTVKQAMKETMEETIEAQVQKALRERWK